MAALSHAGQASAAADAARATLVSQHNCRPDDMHWPEALWIVHKALLGGDAVPAAGAALHPRTISSTWDTPTATYPVPDGAKRLEYATGPFGRTTWMVDTDAASRVTQSRQVLNEAAFLRVQ